MADRAANTGVASFTFSAISATFGLLIAASILSVVRSVFRLPASLNTRCCSPEPPLVLASPEAGESRSVTAMCRRLYESVCPAGRWPLTNGCGMVLPLRRDTQDFREGNGDGRTISRRVSYSCIHLGSDDETGGLRCFSASISR